MRWFEAKPLITYPLQRLNRSSAAVSASSAARFSITSHSW